MCGLIRESRLSLTAMGEGDLTARMSTESTVAQASEKMSKKIEFFGPGHGTSQHQSGHGRHGS